MSDYTCTPALRVTLPAHRDSLALLRHVMRGFRDAYAIGPSTMDDIVLAVSEAATNVVVHAYGRRQGTMTIVASMQDGRLHVLVRDHGCGILPPADTPMLGHGLALIEHVAASLEIVGSSAGTDILMTFDLAPEHGLGALRDYDAAS
ncbi:MAG: serine/threonine-protein kinase RsbW [Solirubrobacteraceae bacterium]|jgi:anti-sigma regulatory factor (Ser/Thr protein kinase)|nr:serine/threonine-protein kinase RsbW [Solirubrobacteraceae bacterium]